MQPWKQRAAYRYTVESSVYLSPAAAGRGLGRALMEALIEATRARGVREMIAVIADEKAESPFDRAADLLTKEALREALENLSYRERRVLELRYGLGGEHPRTLDEVGRTFNVTRERIRQIENQSLKKLQSLAEAQKLRDVA